MRNSSALNIGDIVEVAYDKRRMGFVVDTRLTQVGIRYFKPSVIQGTPTNFVWWIHRSHVRIISAA